MPVLLSRTKDSFLALTPFICSARGSPSSRRCFGCCSPDGLFLPRELDADTAGGRSIAANDGSTGRRDVASRRHGWRADTLPLARAAPLPCRYDFIRDRRTGGRLDRLCGGHLALGS